MERLVVVETTSIDWKSIILAVELQAQVPVRYSGIKRQKGNKKPQKNEEVVLRYYWYW